MKDPAIPTFCIARLISVLLCILTKELWYINPSSNGSANKRSVNDTNHPFESNFGDITKLQNS
jgi:hypothetical protein